MNWRVKLLIARGAKVDAWDNYALAAAARYGHAETMRVLLAAGADGNRIAGLKPVFAYAIGGKIDDREDHQNREN
jgi:ankyrin repeat protein